MQDAPQGLEKKFEQDPAGLEPPIGAKNMTPPINKKINNGAPQEHVTLFSYKHKEKQEE